MRNKLLLGYGLLVLGYWFSTSAVVAQDNVIDEVIWIVGEEAVLRSEVEEERLRAQYEGQPIAGDPYCVIPEQLAIQKLFLHQAELDSVEVNVITVMESSNHMKRLQSSMEKQQNWDLSLLSTCLLRVTKMARVCLSLTSLQQSGTPRLPNRIWLLRNASLVSAIIMDMVSQCPTVWQ